MSRERADLLGAGLILLASACFATLGPVTRFTADEGVEPLGFAAWRAAIGAVFLSAVLSTRFVAGRRELVGPGAIPGRARVMMLIAASAGALLNLAIFIAFVRISIALSLLVFYIYPALVAVTSVIWFGERLDARRWTALGLSLIGMALVVAAPIFDALGAGRPVELDALGIGLAFVAAVSQTVFVLAARHGYGSVPPAQAGALFLVFAAVVYSVIALGIGNAEAVLAPIELAGSWPLLVFAGIVGAGLPTVAYITGIRRIGAPRAAILATTEPAIGVLLAAMLLDEIPSLLQIVGGALILVAAVLLQARGRTVSVGQEMPATP